MKGKLKTLGPIKLIGILVVNLVDSEKIRLFAIKHALKNALDYGKAMPDGVLGKVIAEFPDCKKDMQSVKKVVSEAVAEVNAMKKAEIEEKIRDFEYAEKSERSIGEKIRDRVRNALPGKVVTRIPPEPNAPGLHIGHAKAMWLDRFISDIFNGKCILRWDDTNPEKEKCGYDEEIKKDLEWLGIRWDDEKYSSDNMELFYKLCRRLLQEGNAYVCTCTPEKIKESRACKKECECRARDININIEIWEQMLAGKIEPGKAVVRLKGEMNSENTTLRDPSLFRIVDIKKSPHFLQGDSYHVWPLYDFQSAVMDSPDTIGITHPLRSKEYELRNELYFRIMDMLGLSKPELITISRLSIPGYPVSKRLIKPLAESGKVWGWDDPRLVTIKGLARRGIQPEAIKNFVLQFGISTSESSPDLEKLFAENRKIVDPTSQRRMFVHDPVKIIVENSGIKSVTLKNHPENELGQRKIQLTDTFYIPRGDFETIEEGEIVRLKDLFNIRKENGKITFCGNESLRDAKKIQWVSESAVKCIVYIPGRLFDDNGNLIEDSMKKHDGLCEKSCMDLKSGDIIQFERYGFVRIDNIDKDKKEVTAIFCHK